MSDFFIDIFFFVFFIWSHFYIDCIRFSGFVQKTISRFARNTQDSLNYSRKLKNLGIPIIFEKESINTMEASGEFLLTLMAMSPRIAWLGTGVAACKYARSGNIHLKSALITLPFAALAIKNGARIIRPIMLCVTALLVVKLIADIV